MFTKFKFKDIHSDYFGIMTKTKNRPILPAQKNVTVSVQNSDSQYDFSSANAYNRPFYEDRIFEMEILVQADTIQNLQNKLSSVAMWLMGSGELVFDDMPYVKWQAKVLNGIDFAPKIYGREAVVSVQFRVKPWSESIFDSDDLENIVLGTDIPLKSDIWLDPSTYFNFALSKGSNTITVINLGTYYARPVFEFVGSCGSLTIVCGDKTLEYSKAFEKLSVDTQKQCFTVSGEMMNKYSSGEFFELKSGANKLKITAGSDVNMRVVYTPKFIYNNPMFGGEQNAGVI